MHLPTKKHWIAAKCLLRYLKHTIFHGLHLRHKQPLSFYAFSDVDWACNPHDQTSTSAYHVYLGGDLISWSSKKQKPIARFSIKVEYSFVASTTTKLSWLLSLLQELGINTPPPTIYCDNMEATHLHTNPIFHSRMKLIALYFHFV